MISPTFEKQQNTRKEQTYRWLIEAHTFISLDESYSNVIKETSSSDSRLNLQGINWKLWDVKNESLLEFNLV